jgi:hypothetical protein
MRGVEPCAIVDGGRPRPEDRNALANTRISDLQRAPMNGHAEGSRSLLMEIGRYPGPSDSGLGT